MKRQAGHEFLKLIALRLPVSMLSNIDRIAEITHREKSYLIRKAIEIYLEEYADYQVAIDRLNDETDEIITAKEMRKLVK
jgi:RHH-type rel operon transcriptional repressor/antitoxin RelB